MSEYESNDELDDLSWDPQLEKIYADDSWGYKDVDVDEHNDSIAWKHAFNIDMMDYPEMLLELFEDKSPDMAPPKPKLTTSIVRFPYPKKSVLSRSEMERYLKLEKMFKKVPSISVVKPKQQKDYREFKMLQTKVFVEQEEYQIFLRDISLAVISDYNHIDSDAEKWFAERMAVAAARIKKYKQFYIHLRNFGIAFLPFKNDPNPCPIENLTKELGNKKRLATVSLKTQVPKSINSIPENSSNLQECNYWKKCVVSEDVNAQRLAIAWNADIVIGMSAIQTLADNFPPYQTEWEMPVLVKTYEGLAFTKKHKIAFVDKPLPPRRIAPRDKNHIYFKEIFKRLSGVTNERKENNAREDNGNQRCATTTSGDAIVQLDGANDDESNAVCNNSYSLCKNEYNRGTIVQYSNCERQRLCCSQVNDSILQVDGANDEDEDSMESRTTDEPSKSKKRTMHSSIKDNWLQPRQPLKLRNQRAELSDASIMEPFIGKKSVKHVVSKEENSTGGVIPSSEVKKSKPSEDVTAKDMTAELSFGILPECALSMADELSQFTTTQNSSEISIPVNYESDDVNFTPRRSTRKKSKILKVSLKPLKAKAISAQTSSGRKKYNKLIVQSCNDSSSDDEPLIMTKTKNQQKPLPVKVKNKDALIEISNKNSYSGKTISRPTGSNSMVSESDILGKILGVEPKTTPSVKDISSAWASQAESMKKSDIDNSYCADDLSLHQPGANENVTYSLWKFGKKRILIRYTLHGSLVSPELSSAEKKFGDSSGRKPSDVSLRTKLEYQSDYTFERLTQSEICRDWVTMLFKRRSKIVRARIDPLKKELLDVEWTMTLNHLQDKADKVGYNPAVTTKLFTKVFEMIGDLEKGEYICAHRENEQKINVRKSVDEVGKNVVYDLYKEYLSPGKSVMYTNIAPWVPGDPHKPRKFHQDRRLVPLMFHPKEETGAKSSSRKTKKK